MRKKSRKIVSFLFIVAFLPLILQAQDKNKKWEAPASAKSVKNPVAVTDENITAGKALYTKQCKSCHGSKGKGDGPKAAELDTEPGDFTTEKFQSKTDGELFWMITEGKDDMPKFKKDLPDAEDRWSVVNYIRTLKTK